MPRYELIMIARVLTKEGFSNILRQTCQSIISKGGVVRKIENLGQQQLPYRMRAHAEWHTQGRYFLLDMDMNADHLELLKNELKMEPDIIRPSVVKLQGRYDSKPYEHSMLECWQSYSKP
ncbi:predicted protein [Nematostella vectensis]|uniref:Small ribosomal subunit protein bS6m n=1 Tax=Nematostella vectensis TaxID=45351 RepID=A7RWS6_NEMVE|nr:28S ribosomal protein S6, mitochondrial [Nematostella vectensis]EDO44022.1 predicted protein [Nematostella vectensis]|eukprot:XP_001636085.1 predicted protein [Nematostella vectensis]